MKNILYVILLVTLIITSGCNKWLDIKPKTQIKETEMFKTEGGFQDALIGCYLMLKSAANSSLYEKKLLIEIPEYLAGHWNVGKQSIEEKLMSFDFDSEEANNVLNEPWKAIYKIIAHLNNIIYYLDVNADVFTTHHYYEMTKGEAYAMRSYLYFELLRLFGPSPISAKSTDLAIPYKDVMTADIVDIKTYGYVLDKIRSDLDIAIENLKICDPIIASNINYETLVDPYMANRVYRLNYYAAVSLKARIALWENDKTTAYESAITVINAVNNRNNKLYPLTTKNEMGGGGSSGSEGESIIGDVFMSGENVWAYPIGNKETFFSSNFKKESGKSYNYAKLFEALYNGNSYDIRCCYWERVFSESLQDYYDVFTKYAYGRGNSASIRMIKIAELYLIAAESAPTLEQKIEWLTTFKSARQSSGIASDEASLMQELKREWELDYYGEGQMFYQYKRWESTSMLINKNAISLTPAMYKLPIPQDELLFH